MSDTTVPPSRFAVPGMVGLWLCWGSSFPAIRVMVASMPPLIASGAIFLTAGVVLAAVRPDVLRGLRPRQVVTAAGVGLCLLGAQGAVAVAEQHVYASTAALLVAVIPLWVAVLRGAVGEPPSRGGTVRLLVGFAGVVVVLVAGSGGGVGWSGWCLVVVIDSLTGFALYNWLLSAAPVGLVSTYAYAVPVVAYLVGVLVLGEPFHPVVVLGALAIVAAVAAEVRAAG